MKKITRATFKKFVKENRSKLYINIKSNFDSMVDCCMPQNGRFKLLMDSELKHTNKNTLGTNGIWLVGNSRDYFKKYEDENYVGISVSNCCGSYIVGVQK